MALIFHRYHRWKLRRAFELAPVWWFGRLGPPRELSRGHRQSHGLMYPVELRVNAKLGFVGAQRQAQPLTTVEGKALVFWVDGELLSGFKEGDEVGLLQIGEESVLVASDGDVPIVARSLALSAELEVTVKRPGVPPKNSVA